MPAGGDPGAGTQRLADCSDARHLEDCMMYHLIATRVSGVGDPLTQVRRLFDWTIGSGRARPARVAGGAQDLGQARPGPMTCFCAAWRPRREERGPSEPGCSCRSAASWGSTSGWCPTRLRGLKEPVVWTCAVLIDKKLYLFDTRIGLPVPGADGRGVATLDEALTDPCVLDRLDLPGPVALRDESRRLLAQPEQDRDPDRLQPWLPGPSDADP